MYKLYYSPFSCSLAVHIALEKIGADFELEKVDVRKGVHCKEEFLRLNKRGKVPLLQDGDLFVDQGAAILLYLSDKHPESEMMPAANDPNRAAAISALFYMSNTVHPTLGMAFYPARFSHGDSNDVLSKAIEKTKLLLEEFDQELTDKSYLNGAKPYSGDYYLTVMLNWLPLFKISLDPYPNLKAYKQRMGDLPEVGRASGKEMREL
ncbi:MAG: glutathione S-transferase family protein [Hahellaceae bacterium]|nr:glutathione S-transferase family protein [Hahellaceae bacterium]